MISRAASDGVIGDEVVLAEGDGGDDHEAEQREHSRTDRRHAELRQVIDAAEVGDGEGDEQQADALPLDAARLRIGADELDERSDQIAEEEQSGTAARSRTAYRG